MCYSAIRSFLIFEKCPQPVRVQKSLKELKTRQVNLWCDKYYSKWKYPISSEVAYKLKFKCIDNSQFCAKLILLLILINNIN